MQQTLLTTITTMTTMTIQLPSLYTKHMYIHSRHYEFHVYNEKENDSVSTRTVSHIQDI